MKIPLKRRSMLTGSIMFAPYLILLLLFGAIPVASALITSFSGSYSSPSGGLGNYIDVLTDFRFARAAADVGLFILIYIPLMLIVITVIALILDAVDARWHVPLRVAYIVPGSLSGATAVLVWYFMLEPDLSPYRSALHALGITQMSQLLNNHTFALIFALMAFSTGAGNWIIIQYGSLQSIPEELIEAARLDGCNAVQIAFRIKLPLIRKYLVYMSVLVFATGLQLFVEPQLLSEAGINMPKDWSLNQLSYDLAFSSGDFQGAAALSVLLLVVCVLASLFLIFRTDFFDRAETVK